MGHRAWNGFVVLAAITLTLVGVSSVWAGHEDGKVLLFSQPIAKADAIWMAMQQGFFKDEKLDVTVKWFSAGTTAMQTFQSGKDGKRGFGDFNTGGELPAAKSPKPRLPSFPDWKVCIAV